jgi:beta-glucosidase/6-phospho-beta-glucosidase/beta-galactosidase
MWIKQLGRAALVAAVTTPVLADQYILDGIKLRPDFLFGTGTSAYQIEGATGSKAEGGKGVSIWDTFAHQKGQGHVINDEDGDIAIDFYHTYARDMPLVRKAVGVNQWDMTIAWTRILPNGTGSTPNAAGLKFYKDVAKVAHENGMSVACTAYHWDLPQALQDAYGGWLSSKVVDDFRNYVSVLMDGMGLSCDDWLSMNEPRTFCVEG